jgi:CheY-like chemotaxis protein
MAEAVTIILVEDDDGHASLIERNLRRSGVDNRFLRFSDGQQGLDFFLSPSRTGAESYVLLLDVKMPRMDGIEVLRRLKGTPRTATIPVIMLTTTDDPREIERCYQMGCNVYVTKPVEYETFIDAVKKMGFFLQVVKVPTVNAATG